MKLRSSVGVDLEPAQAELKPAEFQSFLTPVIRKVDQPPSETTWVVTPNGRFGQYPRPDTTHGVLTVPFKGSEGSSRLAYARCDFTESHPMTTLTLTADTMQHQPAVHFAHSFDIATSSQR